MPLRWIVTWCVLASTTGAALTAEPAEDSPKKTQRWKGDAEQSLLFLDAALKKMPETAREGDEDGSRLSASLGDCDLVAAKMADTFLVDLWFHTGSPTRVRTKGETTRDFIGRNLKHYREFLGKHGDASDEKITRLGLETALDAMESVHVTVARRYFLKKWCGANLFIATRGFEVLSAERAAGAFTPSASDRRTAAIYRKWYRDNKSRLKWNPRRRLFEGGDAATLFEQLSEEYVKERAMAKESKEERCPEGADM